MSDAALHVQMLGGLSIRREDREIKIKDRSRKLTLLLARLIQAGGQPVSYQELSSLLWDEAEQGSLNTLKAILHRARACLDQLGEGTGRAAIVSQDGCYRWDPALPTALDTEDFLRLCRAGEAEPDGERRLALWTSALALYRGDFLPGLSSSPWAAALGDSLRTAYFQTVDAVLPLLEERERWEETVRLTQAALALDPFQEELCRRLLEAW